ncbi:ATP-binding cassette domain-containing protein [Pleomorphomonas oryzae]|uniref:ATP-binding cassette domain-containing protein n=1 Tax=Pleomorphomonas oryzae TaxID=261934 RepID=UPI000406479E|nr:ATP-binding cassette domain-containing protein [Pleomorphomonas oryzae]
MSALAAKPQPGNTVRVVLEARKIVKSYGHVVALDGVDFDLRAGEILAVVGDNGAGKSTLIKTLTGAVVPDSGEILLDGQLVHFKGPLDARHRGIETVYQDLAVAPALDIPSNLFLGRELLSSGILGSVFRRLDKRRMREGAAAAMAELKFRLPSINSLVENLSGGQRQGVAVARAAVFASKLVIMDEPTAALGVRETGQVLELIRAIRDRGLPVVLISHNMPNVFDLADRICIMRLGRRAAVVSPKTHTMADVVGIMTGAIKVEGG